MFILSMVQVKNVYIVYGASKKCLYCLWCK